MLRERKTTIGSGARYVARDDWTGAGLGIGRGIGRDELVWDMLVKSTNSGHGWEIVGSPVVGFAITFAVNVNSIVRLLGWFVWQV